jgi:hypothetical protein
LALPPSIQETSQNRLGRNKIKLQAHCTDLAARAGRDLATMQ